MQDSEGSLSLTDQSVSTRSNSASERDFEFPLRFGSILEKGLPPGSTLSLFGPTGAGKTVFCENLTKGFLNDGAGCVFVGTERAPVDIRTDFQTLGVDAYSMETQKRLALVDGYSWLAGGYNEMFRVENLANLPELLTIIERAYNYIGRQGLLVLDSTSPLSLHNPEVDVTRFLQLLAARIKDWGAIGIFVVHAGVYTKEFYNSLAYLVDGWFDMRQQEEDGVVKRYFRIRNLRFSAHNVGWMPFIIEAGRGFRLGDKPEQPK